MTEKEPFKNNILQLQNHSINFLLKFNSPHLAAKVLYQRPSPVAYNTFASLDKLTCTNYVDLKNAKIDFVDFLCPTLIPTIWM